MPDKKQNKQISEAHPHNNAFQRFFSHKAIVIAFLKRTLPLNLLSIIDLTTLTIEKGDFVTYMKGLCDLVVAVQLKKTPQVIQLVFNIEHQSHVRQFIFQKLFKYQAFLYDHYKKRPCLVISVLLYHGTQRWNFPLSFHEHLLSKGDMPQEHADILKPYIIDFRYILSDLSQFDIGKVEPSMINPIFYAFSNIWKLRKMKTEQEKQEFIKEGLLIVDREIREYEKSIKGIKKSYANAEELDIIEVVNDLIRYFCEYNGSVTEKLLMETVQAAQEKMIKSSGGIMNGLDFINSLEQKGIEKGRQEGRMEILSKLLKANIDIQAICKATGLSKQEILSLQKA